MKKKPNCPHCRKGILFRESRPSQFKYKGRSILLDQPGEWCPLCGEAVLTGADALVTEKAFHDFKSEVDDLLTTEEIKRIRKKLKLSQDEASAFFGGGHNAFSRYERGEATPMRAVDNLLRLLDHDPRLIAKLNKARD